MDIYSRIWVAVFGEGGGVQALGHRFTSAVTARH